MMLVTSVATGQRQGVPSSQPSLWAGLLLLLISAPRRAVSLRVSAIEVPRFVEVGQAARLTCSYEHFPDKADPVYSVKWYRGHEQFYEHLPRRSEPTKSFRFPGLTVDRATSSGTSVLLVNVTKATSGLFKCEVMNDKPTFDTDSMEANMTVLEVPSWGPELKGIHDHTVVRAGQIVGLSCSVGLTNPPAIITWLINGQPVDAYNVPTPVVQQYSRRPRPEIVSEVRLYLGKAVFVRGAVRIRCQAELPDVFAKGTEIALLDFDRPQPAGFGWFSSGYEAQSSLLVTGLCAGALMLWGM